MSLKSDSSPFFGIVDIDRDKFNTLKGNNSNVNFIDRRIPKSLILKRVKFI